MIQQHQQDEWLMAQVSQGQRDQFEPLLRRYAGPLLTFIRRMLGDEQRSEELFQEVFLAVWKHRGQYRFPRPFRAWLYGIALNKCRATFRSRIGYDALPLDDLSALLAPVASERSPADAAIATETASLVQAAVALLPVQQRVVVVLRVWGGLSFAEIAEVVERAEGTVRSNMHHGLAAMRRYLEPRLR